MSLMSFLQILIKKLALTKNLPLQAREKSKSS